MQYDLIARLVRQGEHFDLMVLDFVSVRGLRMPSFGPSIEALLGKTGLGCQHPGRFDLALQQNKGFSTVRVNIAMSENAHSVHKAT